MTIQNFKKTAFGIALALGFVITTGLSSLTTVQAQDRRGGQRGASNDQVDRNGNIDRNRNGIDDRYETRDGRVDRNQNGVADENERSNSRNRRNDGYYGNN